MPRLAQRGRALSLAVLALTLMICAPAPAAPRSGKRFVARGVPAAYTVDTDRDGILNARDRDVDGDGISNRRDPDIDRDGVRNGRDLDVDGDGLMNFRDTDIDGDGATNRRDRDMDGDGKPNRRDRDPDADGRRGVRAWASLARSAPVSREFFGGVADAVFATWGRARDRILESSRRTGIHSLRQTFDWKDIEPSPGQWSWGVHDLFVADAARHGMEVLPILFGAPAFAARTDPGGTRGPGVYPPASNAAFADFAARVVRRYGHGGDFWRGRPDLPYRPIPAWEVWNEPNGAQFWASGVDGADYARLLIAASRAIKATDPRARVIAAGLPAMGGRTDSVGPFLTAMYRAGAGPAMDAVALHPYAPTPAHALAIIAEARRVMDLQRDRSKTIWITEYGWATGGPASSYRTSEAGQERAVIEMTHKLARERTTLGIGKLVYYSLSDLPPWDGGTDFWGLYCGLFRIDGEPKPIAVALARAVAHLSGTPAPPPPAAIPNMHSVIRGEA